MEDNREVLMVKGEEWARDIAYSVFNEIKHEDDNVDLIFDEIAAQRIFDEKITDHTELLAIAKAGTFIRYAADDLIKAKFSEYTCDPAQIVSDAIRRKIEEDTVDPADEAEVEKLINETEELIDEIDDEIEEYESDEEDSDDNEEVSASDEESDENTEEDEEYVRI